MPRFKDAQSGSGLPQSAHLSLPLTFLRISIGFSLFELCLFFCESSDDIESPCNARSSSGEPCNKRSLLAEGPLPFSDTSDCHTITVNTGISGCIYKTFVKKWLRNTHARHLMRNARFFKKIIVF